jgi:hypothetical protein
MKPLRTLITLSCFAAISLFASNTRGSLEADTALFSAPIRAEAAFQEGNKGGDKLIYADFETAKDNRPVSSRGGQVMLFSYQERATMPSRYKGMQDANPPAPEFARLSKESQNRAIAFDFELLGLNDYAGVGVQIDGQPPKDGKPVADDVSGFKYLTLQLYATGVTSMAVQFISQGNGIETNGPPEFHFKVLPGLNTYQIRLNSINQPSWAERKVNPKDVLKKLTEIKIVASCNQCVQTKGTVVVDNLIFQN